MTVSNELTKNEESVWRLLNRINDYLNEFDLYIKRDYDYVNIVNNKSTLFNLSRMFITTKNAQFYNNLCNIINNLGNNFKTATKQEFSDNIIIDIIFNNYIKFYNGLLPFITADVTTFDSCVKTCINELELELELLPILDNNIVSLLKSNNIIFNREGKINLINSFISLNVSMNKNTTNIQVMNNGYVNQQPPVVPQQHQYQYTNNVSGSEEYNNQIKASNLVKGTSSNVIKVSASQFHTELMNLDTNSRVLKFTSKNLTDAFATKIVNLKLTIIDIINDIIIKNNIYEINKMELSYENSGEVSVNINDIILSFNLPIALSDEDGYLTIELQERVQVIIQERAYNNIEIVD